MRLAHLRRQGGLERGGVGRERRCAGAEGIDDQDPLRVSGGGLGHREREQEQPDRAPADDPHHTIASHKSVPPRHDRFRYFAAASRRFASVEPKTWSCRTTSATRLWRR